MTTDFEFPKTQCPVCGHWQEDADGFGVLHCEACGYCAHPAIENGRCTICSKEFHEDATKTVGDATCSFIEPPGRDGLMVGHGIGSNMAGPPPDLLLTPARRELVRLLWECVAWSMGASNRPRPLATGVDLLLEVREFYDAHPDVAEWARGLANKESEVSDG